MKKPLSETGRPTTMCSRSFTVVTPNYNMGGYLGATIESVLQNLGPDDQYFIMDGGSSDNSVEIIRSYEKSLTSWVSGPDAGYADAIAKGFRQARGQYLCWLNSGDLLLKGALDRARLALHRSGADMIFGDDLLIDERGKVLQVTNGHAAGLREMTVYAGWTPLQDSCFWTRVIYERIGGIDPQVRHAADYDLFLRMSATGSCRYVPAIFSAFRRHEGQLSQAKKERYKLEREQCRARVLAALPPNPLLPLLKAYYWVKLRWRVRVHGKKPRMGHLEGRLVGDIASQDTDESGISISGT